MRKFFIMLANFIVCAFLPACGNQAEQENPWIGIVPGSDMTAVTERTEYYDFTVETEEIFDLGLWEKNPEEYYWSDVRDRGVIVYNLLGTQFAMGEPAQIWSEASSSGVNIYLYKSNGSREQLLSGISDDDRNFVESRYRGYVDQDKNCYFYYTDYPKIDGEYTYVGRIMKILPTGEIQYEKDLEPGYKIEDICQMEDGKLYLLLNDNKSHEVLEELDPDTGEIMPEFRIEKDYFGGWNSILGAAGTSPVLTDCFGIESVDMTEQSRTPLLYFDGTSYGWYSNLWLQDFRVLEDGTMEFLWTDQPGLKCIRDRIRMEKVEKKPVVLRGFFEQERWLSDKVTLFNQRSKEYHVVLETCGIGNDPEDFARLTSVQTAAGKGPDIVCGNFLNDYIDGMLDKGALEVLNPYLESSGIREEDYFPLVFSMWRQGDEIYSVTPVMGVSYEEMDAEVLGSRETPDIETLADALLAREENEYYSRWLNSGELLNTFLKGSENLWGMVDWETGSCDFHTPLFEKLLEASKRYGYDDRRKLEPEVAESIQLAFFFDFSSPAEQEEKGKVSVGILFDDGCHAVSSSWYTMAVIAGSANKEGAWEFISFLLSEEVQYREETYRPPVHRKSFDKWLEWELWWLTEPRFEKGHRLVPVYYGENTSEEKKEAYKKIIEDARPLPVRTAPILRIIQEEAEYYFDGSKSAEEIIRVINNRVQLYLNERK